MDKISSYDDNKYNKNEDSKRARISINGLYYRIDTAIKIDIDNPNKVKNE